MSHDRCCPLDGPALECVVCDAIGRARNEEKDSFNATWKANLPRVASRYYLEGYRDAGEGRGIARWVQP